MSSQVVHVGAAAASHRTSLAWLGEDTLVVASHAHLCLASPTTTTSAWKIHTTLQPATPTGRLTCLAVVVSQTTTSSPPALVTGTADGQLWLWEYKDEQEWTSTLVATQTPSITTVDAYYDSDTYWIATGSSQGAALYEFTQDADTTTTTQWLDPQSPIATVRWMRLPHEWLLLVGTAAPRHNAIRVYMQQNYQGSLGGHQDWMTCLDYSSTGGMLASGSQDGRIRLWKFVTTNAMDDGVPDLTTSTVEDLLDADDTDDDEEQGESRLDIRSSTTTTTSVFLEALLVGHDDHVTSVVWSSTSLWSSSMDRSLLQWALDATTQQWTPVTRLGSAGGILGGSVGSSLLGYWQVAVRQDCVVGLAHGGSLHVWQSVDTTDDTEPVANNNHNLLSWKATPGLTGHFGSVADLAWEASSGAYLLTVSHDQTCRLWASLRASDVWVELARPQVHGYNLTAIVSVSGCDHGTRHRIVTGADEKELRVLDAPQSTIRRLEALTAWQEPDDDEIDRVERAYIPSLGLSNKPTAADGAEEDVDDDMDDPDGSTDEASCSTTSQVRLPLERDLGVASVWPEVGKLFGHQTEIYCLASTLEAQTSRSSDRSQPGWVASSGKARDDEAAAIRLWNVAEQSCVGLLKGHKSTVAAMSFSPCGSYLVSSGKDRRLCLWKKNPQNDDKPPSETNALFTLAWAKDSAHKRIIWAVHICPFDSSVVVSGSRDGSCKVWRLVEDDGDYSSRLEEIYSFAPSHCTPQGKADAITALSMAPALRPDGSILLALGLESGRLEFWALDVRPSEEPKASLVQALHAHECHAATVTKLAWKPLVVDEQESSPWLLASCSQDHSCRIFAVSR